MKLTCQSCDVEFEVRREKLRPLTMRAPADLQVFGYLDSQSAKITFWQVACPNCTVMVPAERREVA